MPPLRGVPSTSIWVMAPGVGPGLAGGIIYPELHWKRLRVPQKELESVPVAKEA